MKLIIKKKTARPSTILLNPKRFLLKEFFVRAPVIKRVKCMLLESRKKAPRLESISSRKFRILIFEVKDNKAFKGVCLRELTNKRFN